MKLTDQQIFEIADNLDSGMKCFYNKQTGETNQLPLILTVGLEQTKNLWKIKIK